MLVHDGKQFISNRANRQGRDCKVSPLCMGANLPFMDSIERDALMIRELIEFLGKKPSRIASEIGVAATTITRPYKGASTSVLSRATVEKLKARYPEFPGWSDFDAQTIPSATNPPSASVLAKIIYSLGPSLPRVRTH